MLCEPRARPRPLRRHPRPVRCAARPRRRRRPARRARRRGPPSNRTFKVAAASASAPRIAEVEPALQRRERHEPIEGTAIEVVPAELLRQQPADRAFTRAARPVDRDDGCGGPRARAPSPLADTCKPTACATSRKFGNDVATSAVLRISIGFACAKARDRERHRDAVIAAAVDRTAAQTAPDDAGTVGPLFDFDADGLEALSP